jgi:hypothetical protein
LPLLECLEESIKENMGLLRDFFASASSLLAPGGEVHVTLMDRYTKNKSEIREKHETKKVKKCEITKLFIA